MKDEHIENVVCNYFSHHKKSEDRTQTPEQVEEENRIVDVVIKNIERRGKLYHALRT